MTGCDLVELHRRAVLVVELRQHHSLRPVSGFMAYSVVGQHELVDVERRSAGCRTS